MAWLTYLVRQGQRLYHWLALLILLAVILFLGLGVPFAPLDHLMSFWPHW